MSMLTKKTRLMASIILLLATLAYSQVAPEFDWTKPISGTGKDYGRALVVDQDGNIYTTGYYQNTGDFGNGVTLTSFGNYDFYLAKYDKYGNAIWASGGGGTLTDRGQSVVLAPDGNILVTGHLFGTATFSDSTLTSAGNLDMFTAKYDTAGNLLWIKQGFSTSQLSSYGIAVDTAGNSAVACYFGSSTVLTATFGDITLTSYGNRDAAVVKYNPDGTALWAKNMGGVNSGEESNDICIDPQNNIYVTGMFNTEATFGSTNLTSFGGTDIFVTKLDADGNFQWAINGGGGLLDEAQGITYSNGFVYVTGYFDSAATFGSFNLQTNSLTNGDQDFFLLKIDPNGTVVEAVSFGGIGDDNGEDVVADADGNLYLIGEFEDVVVLGGVQITSVGGDDLVMLKTDASMNLEWMLSAGGAGTEKGYGVACDLAGNYLATGYFQQVATFGSTQLTSAGSEDIFITKIGDNIVPVELESFNASVNGSTVDLNWFTATETNNSGFEIERKTEGGNFSLIAFISGNGTIAEPSAYTYADENLAAGKYYYRLKQIDFSGAFEYSDNVQAEIIQPDVFSLDQNYPNPFNPSTIISFDLPVESNVTITIYSAIGEEMFRINKGALASGRHQYNFNASLLSSGIYFYKLDAAGRTGETYSSTKKMTLVR